jgi:hypothetical protein
MGMRALLLLTGIVVVAASGFAKDPQTPTGNSAAEPASGAPQIAAPAAPSAANTKEKAAGQPAETKKQRIRYTFPPAAAKRM